MDPHPAGKLVEPGPTRRVDDTGGTDALACTVAQAAQWPEIEQAPAACLASVSLQHGPSWPMSIAVPITPGEAG